MLGRTDLRSLGALEDAPTRMYAPVKVPPPVRTPEILSDTDVLSSFCTEPLECVR